MAESRRRILCVDDDVDTREMIDALLTLQGYEVIQARSISEALSHAVSTTFDMILLDWVFEDGTGIDLCTKLKQVGVSAPILFYSGVTDHANIQSALDAGAQGFLVKPVDSADLLRQLERLVQNRDEPSNT
jgi:OmpR-family two-component system manganese-sensing response regulator